MPTNFPPSPPPSRTSKAPLGLVSLDDHVKSLPAVLWCAIHVRSWEFGNVLVCACGMMLVAPAPGLLDRMSQPPAPRPASDGFVSPFTQAAQEPAKRGASPEREGLNLHKSGVQEVDKQTLAARLSFLVAALGSQFQPGSLGLVQVGPLLAGSMPQWSSSASRRQQPRGRYVGLFRIARDSTARGTPIISPRSCKHSAVPHPGR